MLNAGSRVVCALALLVGAGLAGGAPALSAPRWVEEGPGPTLNGQTQGLPDNNPVAGAVNAIVAGPTNPDLIYVETVNGGVFSKRTTAVSIGWSIRATA